jgi:hypothetical protein
MGLSLSRCPSLLSESFYCSSAWRCIHSSVYCFLSANSYTHSSFRLRDTHTSRCMVLERYPDGACVRPSTAFFSKAVVTALSAVCRWPVRMSRLQVTASDTSIDRAHYWVLQLDIDRRATDAAQAKVFSNALQAIALAQKDVASLLHQAGFVSVCSYSDWQCRMCGGTASGGPGSAFAVRSLSPEELSAVRPDTDRYCVTYDDASDDGDGVQGNTAAVACSGRKGGKASNALVAGSSAALLAGSRHSASKCRALSVVGTGSEAESCEDDASVPEGDFEFSMDSGVVVCANRVHSLHTMVSSSDAGEGALAGPGRHTHLSLSDDDSQANSKVAVGDSGWTRAAPRQKKAPVPAGRKSLPCMYHFNCMHGARCEMTHSGQERAHFKLQGGPTPMWRTLKCDNTRDPDHVATGKDKCRFYHDIADAWCLVCKAKGHAAGKNGDGGMHCRYQLK